MSGPEELRVILANILRCEYDGRGLKDCVDNDGKPYQSQYLADQIKAAESSLASPAGMEGWQPIETAPKDGKHVLLCVPSGAFFYAVEGAYHNGEWLAAFAGEVSPVYWAKKPTGFRLPAAPRGESG